ncbi:MAG: DUF6455 family protein [Proteobacteria bacterium]|nr:DUF6455 family protein [Pseudomonadota bacterium]
MNFSAILMFFMTISVLATATFLIFAIRKNFQTGKKFRLGYLDQIDRLRFGKMLEKHGINANELLHTRSITEVETQIRNCHGCVKTEECDQVLSKQKVTEKELVFCPNYASLIHQN